MVPPMESRCGMVFVILYGIGSDVQIEGGGGEKPQPMPWTFGPY